VLCKSCRNLKVPTLIYKQNGPLNDIIRQHYLGGSKFHFSVLLGDISFQTFPTNTIYSTTLPRRCQLDNVQLENRNAVITQRLSDSPPTISILSIRCVIACQRKHFIVVRISAAVFFLSQPLMGVSIYSNTPEWTFHTESWWRYTGNSCGKLSQISSTDHSKQIDATYHRNQSI